MPKSLLIQLSLCIAALLAQCSDELWNDPINDLVKTFSGSTETTLILLEVLIVVPEEFYRIRYPIQVDVFFTLERRIF